MDNITIERIGATHGTTQIILWSIKKNGLEKTLEDIRKSVTKETPGLNEEVYKSYLAVLKLVNAMIEDNHGI